jgi:alanyl-tRNA synthetase
MELTKEIATENGLNINENEYKEATNTAKENSRKATKEMFKK